MDEPLEMLVAIRQMRQYTRVYQAAAQARGDAQIPTGPMADLYYEIEDDLHLDDLRATVRRLRRRRAPKDEIEKARQHAEAFAQKVADVRRRRREQSRGRR